MVGNSLGQPHRNDNDDLLESPLSDRTSIQNSPGWPSVRSLSPYPSIRTLNGPDDEEDSEDIVSLSNFSHADSDRSSVFTIRDLTTPLNSRPSTPRAREHMHSDSLEQGVHAREFGHRYSHSHSHRYTCSPAQYAGSGSSWARRQRVPGK